MAARAALRVEPEDERSCAGAVLVEGPVAAGRAELPGTTGDRQDLVGAEGHDEKEKAMVPRLFSWMTPVQLDRPLGSTTTQLPTSSPTSFAAPEELVMKDDPVRR